MVDGVLTQLYGDVMSILGPVLPIESLGGDRRIELGSGTPGRYVVNNQGQLTMRGATVVERDPQTNRPTAVLGADEAALRRIVDQCILPGATEARRMELPPAQEGVFPLRLMLCAEIEIATLKAALLTFEHLLQNDPGRFTWHDSLAETRNKVQQMVMAGSSVDADFMIRTVLGLQYEKKWLDLYQRLRISVPFPETPFEHVIIASGNPGSRVLDLVFWAYRTDPYAFRFHGWSGAGFTYLAVNGILRGTASSEAYRLPCNQLLGEPNMRRSHLLIKGPVDAAEREAMRQEIFDYRAGLCREALDYVERHCDDIVRENLDRYARLNSGGDRTVSNAIRERLKLFFGRRIAEDVARLEFDATVDGVLSDAPEVMLPPENGDDSPDWAYWLQLHRKGLDALRDRFGLPGEFFRADEFECVHEPGDRVLGRLPSRTQAASVGASPASNAPSGAIGN